MLTYAPFINWIDTQHQILMQRVKSWVDINTFSYHPQGLAKLLQTLERSFLSLEGENTVISLPSLQRFENGQFITQSLGQALQIRKRPKASIQIFLGGHFDTVFPPHSSFQKMKQKSDGIWNGPGISDMKGGVAILLTALEAFERTPFAEKIGWEILLTPDEEIGSPGSSYLYERAAKRHHLGIIFEPSFPDGAFVSQRKGSVNYTLLVKGKGAHVGRDFSLGKSAVFPLAQFITLLESEVKDLPLIFNAADLKSDERTNIVPSLASCRFNFRGQDLTSLKMTEQLLEKSKEKCAREGISFEIFQDSFRAPKYIDSATDKLFKAYASCAENLQIPFQTRESGGVCDGNILSGAGLPTIDTAGAVGGALHTEDEYLIESSLIERAKLTALFLMKLANEEIRLGKINV